MKLVPRHPNLFTMTAEDQAFWRGYFQGYTAREIQMNRKTKPFRSMTFAEIIEATPGQSIAERVAIIRDCDRLRYPPDPEMEGKTLLEKMEIMKARNARQFSVHGGGNHAA